MPSKKSERKRSSFAAASRAQVKAEDNWRESVARQRFQEKLRKETRWQREDDWLARLESADVAIYTAAQNATDVDPNFWASLQVYKKERGAELGVMPTRYRNPTSPPEWAKANDLYHWDNAVAPYLFENLVAPHQWLRIFGQHRIAATVKNPLSGKEPLSGGASAIFAHPSVMMTTVATPQNTLPKILATTGACTQRNYSYSDAGGLAEFHYSLGAVIVEKDGPFFHMRNVVGDREGGFFDLDRYYHPKGVRRIKRMPALVLGDTHEWFTDPANHEALWSEDGIIHTLKPEELIFHDFADCRSVSPWDRRNVVARHVKAKEGLTLEHELDSAADYLKHNLPRDTRATIVASNHHDFVKRWLNEDPRKDPANLRTWCRLMDTICDAAELNERGVITCDPVAAYLQARLEDCPEVKVQFLEREDSFIVLGIELAFHGDKGSSGSRGSRAGFSKIGIKVIIGHSHAPGIFMGAYQVGTSSALDPDYHDGPGACLHTHCAVGPNGKRQLFHVITRRGEWAWRRAA